MHLIKPLRRLELLARVESVARRAGQMQTEDEAVQIGDLRVDCLDRKISRNSAVLELKGKDFDLAVLFLRNIDRLLRRSHIQEAVWGAIDAVTSRTLNTHVSRIRNRLGLMPKNGWQLKSVYGHGYQLEQVPYDARHEEAP